MELSVPLRNHTSDFFSELDELGVLERTHFSSHKFMILTFWETRQLLLRGLLGKDLWSRLFSDRLGEESADVAGLVFGDILERRLLVEFYDLDPKMLPLLLLFDAKTVLVLQVLFLIGVCTHDFIAILLVSRR